MLPLYKLAKTLYVQAVDAHVRTLTLDNPKHVLLEEVYVELFKHFHDLGEKCESVGIPVNQNDCDTSVSNLHSALVSYKDALEKFKAPTRGSDNLLAGLSDSVELLIAKLEGAMEKEEPEEETEEETPTAGPIIKKR